MTACHGWCSSGLTSLTSRAYLASLPLFHPHVRLFSVYDLSTSYLCIEGRNGGGRDIDRLCVVMVWYGCVDNFSGSEQEDVAWKRRDEESA